MAIRNYVLLLLVLISSASLSAQEFVTLDWKNPAPVYERDDRIETDMPGFANGSYYPDTYIPSYTRQIDLGPDYALYDYEVKVEYPEFQELPKKNMAAVIKTGIEFPSYPQVNYKVSVSSKRGIMDVDFIPLVYKDGIYQRVNSFKLTLNKKKVAGRVMTRATADKRYKDNSVLASGRWMKIRVSETGVHQITNSQLKRMGFSNPAKVSLYGYGGYLLPEKFDVATRVDDLQEIPLWREANNVLFYAKGVISWESAGNGKYKHTQNHYSEYAYYFLTDSDSPMEFPKEVSLSETDATVVNTFPDYALYEKEAFSWRPSGRKLFDDYDYKSGNTKSYTFNLPGITSDAGTITVAFSAYSSTSTTVTTTVNDTPLSGTLRVDACVELDKGKDASTDYSWTGDKSEKTIVTLRHNRSTGISGHLDYIRLNYTRKLALTSAFLSFRGKDTGKTKFVIDNANENTCVWNVADPKNYRQVQGILSGSQYAVVTDNSKDNEFVAVNPKSTFPTVVEIGQVANQDLHSLNALDMVIIIPSSGTFAAQAERIAEIHRQRDALSVKVVTAGQIYNEFSSGTPDATAYRWFMKMLYDRAATEKEAPKYLLLFGDASYDNRMVTASWKNNFKPDDFLLCFGAVNSMNEYESYVLEDYFGFLDDSVDATHTKAKVDLGIGRIPVRTVAQAKEVTDKIIAYIENKFAGPWKNTITVLGDDGDNNEHMDQANKVAVEIEKKSPEFLIKRIFWDAYKLEKTSTGDTYPDVTKRILELFNEGMLVFNYVGHGGPSSFSHESCLNTSHIPSIHSTKPPLWFTAACEVTPFDALDTSIGEQAFLHTKGAAIGLFTTARTVYGGHNHDMNMAFISHLFSKVDGERISIGEAVKRAKVERVGKSTSPPINNLNFVYIGDPAMKLAYPDYKIVLDEFNGSAADGAPSTIKAGELVTVTGRVLDSSGQTAQDYNGFIYPTILDNREKVVTNNNQKVDKGPFTYEDRNKVLFSGSDSINAGTFKFKFPVPLDINYSYESGMVNLYAVEKNRINEGQGVFTNFLIGGTANGATVTDSVGPKINLYLNTPDFIYGGKVNEAPYLVAELEDEDGINTVGNGIGHDLMAVIDNSPVYSYVLNNYYESATGDYKKGIVKYSLPELPEGKHQLLFRAWDIKNNSSTATLEFEVVKGLRPGLFDVSCTKSPAKENTTFILTHDRPEAEMDVQMSVYDFSGKVLWMHEESGVSSDNYYYIDWNLTTSAGQRLAPGIYLFRAAVSCNGSKESTKARKIVILAQ